MREELRSLWKLQKLDTEISDLELRKEEIPKEIHQSSEKVKVKEEEFHKKQKQYEEITNQRRKLEQDVKEAKDTVSRYKSQLLQVKTNKEYQSLLHEINTEETKISAYEEEILDLLGKSDELSIHIERIGKELEKRREKFTRYEKRKQEELSQVNTVLLIKREERERLASKVNKMLLSRYEQIRRGRAGLGIVEISESTCKGCNAILPPQFVVEIKQGNKVLTCEQCGRILVWKENVD